MLKWFPNPVLDLMFVGLVFSKELFGAAIPNTALAGLSAALAGVYMYKVAHRLKSRKTGPQEH